MPGLNRRGGDGNKKTSRGLGASSRLRAHRAGARGSVRPRRRPPRAAAPRARGAAPRAGQRFSSAGKEKGRGEKGNGAENRQQPRNSGGAQGSGRARPRSAPHRRRLPAGTPRSRPLPKPPLPPGRGGRPSAGGKAQGAGATVLSAKITNKDGISTKIPLG